MDMKHQWRLGLAAVAMAGLAACQPAVPDSGAGVGFGDYSEYQRQREAQLSGQTVQTLPAASAISAEPLNATGTTTAAAATTDADSPEAIAAQTRAALASANQPAGFTPSAGGTSVEPLQASPSNPAPVVVNSAGISNENDFSAVDEQRTIAEDAALIEQNRANYTQVQPEALPTRADTGPNIVAYALQTTHNPGVSQYRRSGLLNTDGKAQRVCASYASPDLAQVEFLKNGGPERDRKGVDPDGDGFACSWDPRPFRKAAGG